MFEHICAIVVLVPQTYLPLPVMRWRVFFCFVKFLIQVWFKPQHSLKISPQKWRGPWLMNGKCDSGSTVTDKSAWIAYKFLWDYEKMGKTREYWINYSGPGFLAVVWLGSPPPLPSSSCLFLSFPVWRWKSLLTGEGQGGDGAKSDDGEKAWPSTNHSILSG